MTIRIKVDMIDAATGEGTSEIMDVPERAAILQRVTVIDDLGRPVVSVPFYLHGRSLHTICRLGSPDVVDVEW